MDDYRKVAAVEAALRSERDTLRKLGGPDNVMASNTVNTYLQRADTDSKLRLYDLIVDDQSEKVVRLRGGTG